MAGTVCWCALGCSFITVSGPPSAPEERTEKAANECTTIVTAPVFDANLAVWTSAVLMVAAAKADSFEHSTNVEWFGLEMSPETAMAVGITNLAIFGSSATYGFIQTSRCRALQQEVRAEKKPVWSPVLSTTPAPRAVAPPALVSAAPAAAPVPTPAPPPPASTPPPPPTVSFPDP